jgi:hypothetical protein
MASSTEDISANQGRSILATIYVFLVLSTLAVALRFWSRHVAHRAGFWWDDWVVLIALVSLGTLFLSDFTIYSIC